MSRRGLVRWYVLAGMAVALLGLYAIIGFLVAPRIVPGSILKAGSVLGGASIGLGKVSVNPFSAALERLIRAFEVPADALRELAQRRAAAVKQRLLAASGIDPSRVFLLDADTEASVNEGTVRVTLTLDAR